MPRSRARQLRQWAHGNGFDLEQPRGVVETGDGDGRGGALVIPASIQTAPAVALAARALAGGEPTRSRTRRWRWPRRRPRRTGNTTRSAAAPPTPSPGASRVRCATSTRIRTADCSLEVRAAIAGLSVFHFARVVGMVTGQTPRHYVIASRLRAAATALCATRVPVTAVALDAGFGDLSHVTSSSRRAFGMSPRAYRTRHARR